MKKNILSLLFILAVFSAFSQTKMVAHRSHSGSTSAFNLSEDGNLGWNPSMDKYYNYDSLLKLDSIRQTKIDSTIKANELLFQKQNDSIKKDSVKRNTKEIQPKKSEFKNDKIIQNNIQKASLVNMGRETKDSFQRYWLWFLLLIPFAYFLIKKL